MPARGARGIGTAVTELETCLARGEGKTLEFKRDLSSPGGVLRTLVAFANTSGGTLLIGVEDGGRRVPGVERVFEVEERLASLVSDRILPRLLPEIEVVRWRRTQVLAIRIHPSPVRPHHLENEGPQRGTYVRVGSTNRRADRELIDELRRFVRGESFDEQPLPALDSEALDFRAASESFRGVRVLARRDLETLRLVVRHQGRLVPTVGGMVLFGLERERHVPDAWIQAGCFAGPDRSVILDRAELREPPAQAIEAAIAFVRRHTPQGVRIRGIRHTAHPGVPLVALREAIVNAVVHADYAQRGAPLRIAVHDDRVVVENPGLLPFGLTLQDLPRGVSKLRNRVIGRVFHLLGLVEQWGSGVQRMLNACREAGLPAPEFEELGTRFRVTLATRPVDEAPVADVDRRLLSLLAARGGDSTAELARAIGLSTRATRTRLARLVSTGRVREIGTGPRDPRRRYVLGDAEGG